MSNVKSKLYIVLLKNATPTPDAALNALMLVRAKTRQGAMNVASKEILEVRAPTQEELLKLGNSKAAIKEAGV